MPCYNKYLCISGLLFIGSGLIIPAVLKPAQKIWMGFAAVMGFLMTRKKCWLLPIVIMLVLPGLPIVLTEGSAVASFIYTLF